MTKIIQSRSTNIETWITSEGSAYFVQLQGNSSSEHGTPDVGMGVEEDAMVSFFLCNDHFLLTGIYRTWILMKSLEELFANDVPHLLKDRMCNLSGKGLAFITSPSLDGLRNDVRSIQTTRTVFSATKSPSAQLMFL